MRISDWSSDMGSSYLRLMIELTESAIIGDPDLALSVLSELKALDARVAMDDFGTGYSNLASLQRLPIDVLKHDRIFVEHIVNDRYKVANDRTTQGLPEVLGMTNNHRRRNTPAQQRENLVQGKRMAV